MTTEEIRQHLCVQAPAFGARRAGSGALVKRAGVWREPGAGNWCAGIERDRPVERDRKGGRSHG